MIKVRISAFNGDQLDFPVILVSPGLVYMGHICCRWTRCVYIAHFHISTTTLCLVVDCGSNVIYNFLCVSVTAAPPPRDAPHTPSPIAIQARQSPVSYRACLLLIITASELLYYRYKWQSRSAYVEFNEWDEFCFFARK